MRGKCDGERPTCKTCRVQDQTCEWASEPGETPAISLKRKYDALRAEDTAKRDLLDMLRAGSEAEVLHVLRFWRSSDDVDATLNVAQNLTDGNKILSSFDELSRPIAHQASP